MMEVLVLGAGVSGLTVAWRLLERGHRVRLWARESPLETTSAVAAALWYPFEAQPADRVADWAIRSLEGFRELAQNPETGVRFHPCLDLADELREPPTWAARLPGFERTVEETLLAGYRDGWRIELPVIETPIYLPWLVEQIRSLGGEVEQREVHSLDETRAFPVVVLCTGLGSRELANDDQVFPIRGQIERVEQTDIDRSSIFMRTDGSFGYIVPRSADVILGGTAKRDEWSLASSEEATRRIRDGCTRIEPSLADASPLGTIVGLRPGRTEVRLEAEPLPDGRTVVHNYGHGGCGVTLSLACAEDVVALVEKHGRAS